MTVQLASNIKTQIVDVLQTLQTAGTIASYYAIDQYPDPLTMPATAGYPFAIVGMPRITSDFEDQANNIRTYRYDVLFALNPTNLTNPTTDVENLIDAVLNEFDTNFTLSGAATAAVLPASVQGAPISTGSKTLLVFVVTLEARTTYTIGT